MSARSCAAPCLPHVSEICHGRSRRLLLCVCCTMLLPAPCVSGDLCREQQSLSLGHCAHTLCGITNSLCACVCHTLLTPLPPTCCACCGLVSHPVSRVALRYRTLSPVVAALHVDLPFPQSRHCLRMLPLASGVSHLVCVSPSDVHACAALPAAVPCLRSAPH